MNYMYPEDVFYTYATKHFKNISPTTILPLGPKLSPGDKFDNTKKLLILVRKFRQLRVSFVGL